MDRLNITLDDDSAARLRKLADSAHVQPGALARSLLIDALDDADPDARNMVELLDSISGAFERAQLALVRPTPATRSHSVTFSSVPRSGCDTV